MDKCGNKGIGNIIDRIVAEDIQQSNCDGTRKSAGEDEWETEENEREMDEDDAAKNANGRGLVKSKIQQSNSTIK